MTKKQTLSEMGIHSISCISEIFFIFVLMTKRIACILILLLTTTSMLAGLALPHHHHPDSSICFIPDIHHDEDECDHNHPVDTDCCSVKFTPQASQSDHRKESICPCGEHFHDIYILSFIAQQFTQPEITSLSPVPELFRPFSNFYHSVLSDAHLGFRAPPFA